MNKIVPYLKYIIIVVLIIIACLIYYFISHNESNQEIISIPETILKENEPPVIEEKTIFVDVKGEVNNPGVYELASDSRVQDAIEKSGGITNKADISVINLSKKLEDEMVIIVYSKDETSLLRKPNEIIKYVEKECVCPKLTNDACISNNEVNTEINKEIGNKNQQKISLNSATLEELQTLPGIGHSKASEIINYRETNGGFKKIEELMNISGIGQSTFEKLKDLVTI